MDYGGQEENMINEKGFGRVTFTYLDAFRLGTNYLKRRLDRVFMNITSIALAISFLTSLIFTDILFRTYSNVQGTTYAIENYQYLLVTVAFIVSVVGITNSMLITVFERYREIGTMKCIGALNQHILMIFLVEAVIQGFLGGIIGYILGLISAIISTGGNIGFRTIFNVPIGSIITYGLGTVVLSMILTVIAIIYPSLRAAGLNPVEALRYEL
jgi:ABC-type antimicrobial peptide transport system permease subunit